MLTKNIDFRNFQFSKQNKKIKKNLDLIIKNNNEILKSLSKSYINNFFKKDIIKYKKSKNFRVIGMGGSILGTQAIYDFLKYKIKKNFIFINNLNSEKINYEKKKYTNLIVSKSGNTIETIVNSNIIIKKKIKIFFLTENRDSYLFKLAKN